MNTSRPPADEPVLITSAELSPAEEHAARQRKYVLLMSMRVVCLILAAVSFHIKWLMLIFAVSAVVLPWMAVLIANDHSARRGTIFRRFRPRPRSAQRLEHQAERPELPPASRDTQVIDVDLEQPATSHRVA